MHGMRTRGAQDRGTRGREALNTDILRTARHYFLLLLSWLGSWCLAPSSNLLLRSSGRFIINSLSYSKLIGRSCRQASSRFGFPEAGDSARSGGQHNTYYAYSKWRHSGCDPGCHVLSTHTGPFSLSRRTVAAEGWEL